MYDLVSVRRFAIENFALQGFTSVAMYIRCKLLCLDALILLQTKVIRRDI